MTIALGISFIISVAINDLCSPTYPPLFSRPGLEYTIECDLLRQNSFTMRLSCLPSTNTVFQKQIQTVVNTLQKFIRLQHTQGGPLDSLKQFVQEQVATREEPLFLTVEATEVIDEMDGYCSPVEVTSGPPPTDNVVATIDNPFYENDDGVCGQNKYMQGYACFYCNDVSQMRKGSSPAQLQNSFPRRVDLRLHIEKKHMQTINGKIGLDCPVCPRKFRSKTAVDPKRTTNLVLQHVREAHNLQYMPEQSIENAYKQSNIPCYYCSDVCENVPQLKAHLQENHVTKKDGRYTLTCTLCKNEYNTAQLNNTHYIVQLLFKHMFNKHFTKDSTRKDSISKNSQRTNVNSKPTLNESSTDQSVVVGNVPHVMDANPSYQGSSGSTPQTLQPSFGSQTLVNGPLHFQSPLMLGGDLNIGDPFTNVCDVQLPFANACNLHPPSVGTQSSAPILRTIRMKEEVPSLITQMGSQQQVTFLLVKDPPVKNDDESQNSEEQNTKWFSDENADATCQENSMDGYICFFCNDERLINKSRTMPVPVRHSYKSKIDLRLHIQAKHMTIIEEELAISCPLCPRTFRSKVTTQPKRMMNKFFQHVRDDHDVKYMPTVSLDNACKRSNIQCYYCDEISDNCTLFTTHLKENHVVVDNGKHSMICPLCAKDYSTTQANKTFHIAQLLTRHMFYKHELGGKSLSVDDGGGDSAAHDFATDPNSSAPNMQHSLVENRKDEDMDNSSLNHTNGTHGGNWITQEIATNESYYCFFCTSLPEGTPSSTRHCKPLDSLDCLKKHIRSFHIKQRTCNSSIECPMCLRTVSCNSKGDQEHMVDYIISHVCLCHSYTRNAVLSGMVKNKDHQYVTTEQEHGCHASPKTQVVASTHSCFCFFCNDAMSMIRLKDPRCLKNPLGNRGELKKHIMEAHVTDLAEIPAITCPVCQSVFSCIHEENLLNRYLNHVMEKHGLVFEYVCDGVLSDSNSSFCSLINSQRESRDLEYTGPSKGVFETRNHDSEATTEQKPVLCIFCGLTCHGGDQLIQHIVEGHVTQLTGRISLMCPVCDQVLQSPKEPNELVHRLLLHLDKDHQVRPQGSDSVVIRGRIPTPGKGHINVSLGHASGGEDGAVFDLSHGNQASDKEHREASSQDNNRPTHHTYHCIFCEQALLAVRGVELYQPEARFASIDQLCKHIATTHVEGRSTKQWLPCPFNGGCKLVANRCGPYTLAAAALEHITDAHHVQFSVYQHPEESGHLVAGSDTEIQLCNNTKLFQCNTNVCVICAMGRESSGSDQTALMDVEIVAADVVFDCEENLKKHLTLHHTSESSEDSETSRAIECPICSRSIIAYRANGDVACDFLNHIKDVHFLYYQSDVCMALLKESWVVGKTVQSNCVFVIDDWEQLETSFSDFIDDHKNINLDTTCEACQDSTNDFSFSTLQELVDHLLENHRGLLTEDVESLKCPFCPWILAWQISDDPNYSSCAKHFVNHLAIQHCSIEKEGMLEEPRPTSTSGNRAPRSSPSRMDYYCFFCLGSEQRFSVLEDLKEHMLTHVASHSGLESIISCPSCDFRVIRGKEQFRPGGPSEAVLQILAEHMLLKHQHPAPHWIPMLRCKLCGWDTLVRTSLIQHYRQLHFKDKPPKPRNTCPHCTKQLNTEQELNDHIQAAHMRREKVVDGKKKTATCDMCGRLFCDERSRIQHAWLKHKVRELVHLQYIPRDHLVYVPSLWEGMLQCNVVSHWLGAYTA